MLHGFLMWVSESEEILGLLSAIDKINDLLKYHRKTIA
jgi:hypothetical protein